MKSRRMKNRKKTALQESNFGDKERTASVDAAIQYNENQKQFTLISDVQGNQIDESRMLAYVDQGHWSLFFPSQLSWRRDQACLWEQMYISSHL